jgi:hypothetical protein
MTGVLTATALRGFGPTQSSEIASPLPAFALVTAGFPFGAAAACARTGRAVTARMGRVTRNRRLRAPEAGAITPKGVDMNRLLHRALLPK